MKKARYLVIVAALALLGGTALVASAHAYYRQYYGGYSYYPQRSYYYSYYYYQPYDGASYSYNYCIYYPQYSNYCYYYSPYSGQYWGRYDFNAKGYSMLKPEDRKASLKEIPESAFPTPGKMPPIPDSKDNVAIEPPPAPPKDVK